MLNRRSFVLTSLALATGPTLAADNAFAALETKRGGRLGVAALDTATGKRMTWRANERFSMCSTFKTLAVSAVLSRIDRGEEKLERRIPYGKADILEYAPVTKAHIGEGGMTIGALCEAAVEFSDNTAANLLLKTIGGPGGATSYVRTLRDTVTRMDRFEPDANTCIAGDPRDTTTPDAMLGDIRILLLGRALAAPSRMRLMTWLVNYQTRFPRISAGLPTGWRSGHKMGTGAFGTVNDVSIVWPPKRAPLLVA
ncbi:MAG: class A beta-lactamase, partial [Rhizomicrobium sp.]